MSTATGRKEARYVLGVNPGPHDASAALLRDGALVSMIEQERLSRSRHAFGEFPTDAIAACLAGEGIGLDSVAQIAVGWDMPALRRIEGGGFDESKFKGRLLAGIDNADRADPPIRYVSHHLAHAACAFYTSGLHEAAILIADGRGESVATSIAIGSPSGIELIETWGTNMSLGHLYACAAAWAGLTVWGAGKLMGLAAYGRASQPVPLRASDDGYTIAGAPPPESPASSHFQALGESLLGSFRTQNYPFVPGEPNDVMAHANFAASIQAALEDAMLSLARRARSQSGYDNLVLGGGVALNCAANSRLIRSGIFGEVWVPPVPHDGGVSLGAAIVADRDSAPARVTPSRLPHAFWAPVADESEAEALASLSGCNVEIPGDTELCDRVAEHLLQGRLVAWWQGRSEVGQRALGARSILADPRSRHALVRTNEVKGRESWRPLAPAVLAEHAGTIFADSLPAAADFMLTAWPVRERAQAIAPAAVHVDGTARPQVVGPERSLYRDVIGAFFERTGLPAVINTSFNLAGEPIVLSARDAVRAFLRSDLDVLVLGNAIAEKPADQITADSSTAEKFAFVNKEVSAPLRLGRHLFKRTAEDSDVVAGQ